jgi:hypothetical protein
MFLQLKPVPVKASPPKSLLAEVVSFGGKAIVSLVLVVIGAMAALAQDLSPLKRVLGEYQPYDPPRANWGPGFVFTGNVGGGRISNVEELCPNLYADLEAPQSAAIVLADYNASDGFSFGASLRFLKGLFGLNFDVDKIGAERTIDVKWQNLREYSYTGMDKWLETGEPRPIAKRCRLAINELKAKDRFKDRVFVIVRAIAPASMIYEFGRAVNAKGSASAQLWQEVQANAQVRAVLKNGTRLEIRERMFMGYIPPKKLRDWLPTGHVSGEIVRVTGGTTDLVIDR